MRYIEHNTGPRRGAQGAQTWEIDSKILQAAPNRGGKRGWRGCVGNGGKINWWCEGCEGKNMNGTWIAYQSASLGMTWSSGRC